jgi:hypothetical protein
MSLRHGASIARNGLVFQYDMSNTKKSWKGAPVTNLLTGAGTTNLGNGAFLSGAGTRTDLGGGRYRFDITQQVTFRMYCNLSTLTNGQTYGCSLKFEENTCVVLTLDWCDTSVTTGINSVAGLISGKLYGIATRGEYNTTYRFLDINIGPGTVILSEAQVDSISISTPYVNGTRSNTEAIIDLTGENVITAVNTIYGSDNTFSFEDPSNSYLSIGKTRSVLFPSIDTYSYLCIAKRNGEASTAHSHAVVFGAQGYNTGILWYNNGVPYMGAWYASSPWASIMVSTNVAVSDDTWVHIAGTFNAYGDMKVYLNGELKGTVGVYANTVTSNNVWYEGSPVSIGGGPSAYQFNGSVAMALGYDRELSAEEIAEHFEAMRGRYGI